MHKQICASTSSISEGEKKKSEQSQWQPKHLSEQPCKRAHLYKHVHPPEKQICMNNTTHTRFKEETHSSVVWIKMEWCTEFPNAAETIDQNYQ